MSNRPTDYRPALRAALPAPAPATPDFKTETRDTIIKSSLTGVAATMLAVTIFSPAGLGGMIGTSLASASGADPSVAPADDPYANLPAFPSPLSESELSDIRGQLASTDASLEITRAATQARIEHIRAISLSEGAVTFTPLPLRQTAQIGGGLRLRMSDPPATPATLAVETQAAAIPASDESGGGGGAAPYARGSHLELAELMFAHENF